CRTWQQTAGEAEPDNIADTRSAHWLRLMMIMVSVVVMMVTTMMLAATPQAQKHAHSKQHHQDAGQQRQPRLCLLGYQMLTTQKRCDRQNPNDHRVSNCGR